MTSSATEEIRLQSDRIRGGRQTGSARKINITLLYDNETDQITVDENQTVGVLQSLIEARLKIPTTQQFLYGWPKEEPADGKVKLKDLGLDNEPLLYVAVKGALNPSYRFGGTDSDGEVAGTSSSSDGFTVSSNSKNSKTYNLFVVDTKNKERYEDMQFTGNQTVLHVMLLFADLSGIPVTFQEWSGWPEGVTNSEESKRRILEDIQLDRPFHSLYLSDKRDLQLSIKIEDAAGGEPKYDNQIEEEYIVSKIEVDAKADEEDLPKGILETLSLRSQNMSLKVEKIEPLASDEEMSPHENEANASQASSSVASEAHHSRKRSGASSEPVIPKKKKGDADKSSTGKSPRKRNMCYILSLAETKDKNGKEQEVAIQKILQFLNPQSILSLRRTCKTTNRWVSTYSSTSIQDELKWNKYSLTITGQDHKTFETAANMNLPISRFIFEVDNETFYEPNSIDSFIPVYYIRVRNVRLRKCFMFQNPGERRILESFLNLEELTIDELIVTESVSQPCPAIFANLQVLKLNYEVRAPNSRELIRPKCWDMTWSMLSDCTSLLYFRLPQIQENNANTMPNAGGIFSPLIDYMAIRDSSGQMSLEVLDVKHFNNPESNYVTRFVDLLQRCYKRDIKLKNVHALVVQSVFDDDGRISDERYKFCENFISLINFSSIFENAPLRNLEKITIDVVPSATNYYEILSKQYKDMFWPQLHTIKIKDTLELFADDELWRIWQEIQENLYGHKGTFSRGSVRYIRIDSRKVPYFLSQGQLAKSFFNLTRLEIASWSYSDQDLNSRLHPIWKKLRLEVLRIEKCPQLNDASFVGTEEDDEPPFLKLSRSLKKLTLDLEETSVTDLSLLVFSEMPIKSLTLLSSSPTKISEGGILKLRNGVFGKNIEYFPFHCWSSNNIDPRRFERLGKSFRSLN